MEEEKEIFISENGIFWRYFLNPLATAVALGIIAVAIVACAYVISTVIWKFLSLLGIFLIGITH